MGNIGLDSRVLCSVWFIYDVFMHQKKMKTEYTLLWTVAAVMFSIVTAIVYYFIMKKYSLKKHVKVMS